MTIPMSGRAQRVTIYVGEEEQLQHQALYMVVLQLLRKRGAAGATVTRGLAGFGAHGKIHSAGVVSLSADLPIRIEWIDAPDKVAAILPDVRAVVTSGIITVEEVIMVQRSSDRSSDPLRMPVSSAMQTPVIAVQGSMPVDEVVALLLEQGVRALPVTDEDHKVIGMITDADLLERTGLHARLSLQGVLSDAELGQQLAEIRQRQQTAAEIMTPDPVMIGSAETLATAVDRMRSRGLKRLPVIDEFGRLAGMLTRLDVLQILDQAGPAWTGGGPRTLRNGQSIAELMNRAVPVVSPGARLDEIVDALVRSQQLRVIVADSRRHPLGIITDGDLLSRCAPDDQPGLIARLRRLVSGSPPESSLRWSTDTTALDLMTRPIFTVALAADLTEALHLMMRHQVKRLPVVDEEGALVGILGRANLLRGLVTSTRTPPTGE